MVMLKLTAFKVGPTTAIKIKAITDEVIMVVEVQGMLALRTMKTKPIYRPV